MSIANGNTLVRPTGYNRRYILLTAISTNYDHVRVVDPPPSIPVGSAVKIITTCRERDTQSKGMYDTTQKNAVHRRPDSGWPARGALLHLDDHPAGGIRTC